MEIKNICLAISAFFLFLPAVSAESNDAVAAGQEGRKKVFIQVGAIEKVESDKYTMRKLESRIEFYITEGTPIFLRTESSTEQAIENSYLVIKGPKNKKAALANTVYIYKDKQEYLEYEGQKEKDGEEKVFSAGLEGKVKRTDPYLVIETASGEQFIICYDQDTYWVLTSKTNASELKPGERIKLFFDKLYSIRYKNYPIKIIIDRIKANY